MRHAVPGTNTRHRFSSRHVLAQWRMKLSRIVVYQERRVPAFRTSGENLGGSQRTREREHFCPPKGSSRERGPPTTTKTTTTCRSSWTLRRAKPDVGRRYLKFDKLVASEFDFLVYTKFMRPRARFRFAEAASSATQGLRERCVTGAYPGGRARLHLYAPNARDVTLYRRRVIHGGQIIKKRNEHEVSADDAVMVNKSAPGVCMLVHILNCRNVRSFPRFPRESLKILFRAHPFPGSHAS